MELYASRGGGFALRCCDGFTVISEIELYFREDLISEKWTQAPDCLVWPMFKHYEVGEFIDYLNFWSTIDMGREEYPLFLFQEKVSRMGCCQPRVVFFAESEFCFDEWILLDFAGFAKAFANQLLNFTRKIDLGILEKVTCNEKH
jgi:hypothetical protein